ncbi:MAG: flagellar filament capping protein FliD [Gemmatimonadetes bacterium]|nr:flagellar filament capping protein FliD [Gemmatimonadota bacterium]
MASTSLSSVNGIASGVQWQDLVTQIIAAESARSVDPLTAKKTTASKAQAAWKSFEGVAATFRDAATPLTDPALFGGTTVSVPAGVASTLTATGSSTAIPGRYDVEALQLARTDKMGGGIVADPAAALNISGSLVVNGRAITVAATDTLQGIRDKFNAANTGTTASGVSAVIQGSASGGARLVLTAGDTGSNGIEVADGTAGTLAALGLTDGTTTANTLATGEQQTFRVSSSTTVIASLLGVPVPTPATMNVGGQVIHVDLATDSLAAIAARINNALGRSDAARIVTETANGRAQQRLVTTVPVASDASVDAAASTATLALLGFTTTGRGGVAQRVGSASNFTGLAGAATGTTLLTDLGAAGGGFGLAAGDVLTLRGTRGDGSAVVRTVTVGAGTTMQDLLDALNNATTGFGAGTRPAAATLDGSGKLTLTDSATGDSQLGLGITVTRAGGGTGTLGAFTTAAGTLGRAVGITAGQDAVVRVDGQVSTQRSNSVTGAIAGVTLNLTGTTTGTPVTLTVNRDTAGVAAKLNTMVTAYNNLRQWVSSATAAGGPLANDPTVRSMVTTLTNQILNSVPGLASGQLANAALMGLQHDKTGILSLDTTVLTGVLATQPFAVQQLFAMTGDTTDPELSYVAGTTATKPSSSPYAVTITQAATQASATGAVWTTYATTGAPDTMTVTDASTGRTTSVSLANGDALATVVARLNAAFSANGLALTAGATNDNRLQLTARDFGSTAGFTIAYTPGAGGDGTAALGLAAGRTSGLDVAGTINGKLATGSGQALTGAKGDASEGLVVRYTGTTARAAGTVRFSQGLGGALTALATNMAAGAGSTSDARIATLQTRMDDLDRQVTDQQQRLDNRKKALTAQFIAMESAIAKSNSLASALTAQMNALTAQTK